MTKANILAVCTAVVALPFVTMPVAAQDDGAGVLAIEEILVTARKRTESLQQAPVAVSAFDADAISDFSMQSIDDVARYTPGFSFSKAFGRTTERPVIRGAANILAGVQFGVEAGAAYFIDGVYYPGDIQSIDMDAVQRVEIIKGPQSALYGRNTYSGAINFIMKGVSDEFEGRARAEFADHEQSKVSVGLAGPIVDGVLGGRLNASYYDYGGEWINATSGNTIGEERSTSISGLLQLTPSETTTFDLRMTYTDDDDGIRPFALVKNINNCYPGLRSTANYDPNYLSFLNPPFAGIFPTTADDDNPNQYYCGVIPVPDAPTQDTNGIPFIGVKRQMLITSLKGDFELGNGGMVTAAITRRDQDLRTGSDSDHQPGTMNFFAISPFFSIPQADGLFNTAGLQDASDDSFEIRYQSPEDRRFRWLIGAFYYDQSKKSQEISFAFDRAANFTGPVRAIEGTTNTAVFGMIEYDFSDRLTGSFEIRSANEEKTLEEFVTNLSSTPFERRVVDFDSTAPRAVLNFKATDDMMLYGSYAKGIKPGGLNGATGVTVGLPQYDEEESDNLEFGVKADWMDGRLRTNLSLYRSETDNYQLTTAVGVPGTSNVTSVVTTQSDAEVFGIELDVRAAISENITGGLTYALTDSEFKDGCDPFQFVLTSGGYTMSDVENVPVEPLDENGNPIVGDCSIDGNEIPMVSKNQASGFLQFDFPMAGDRSFFATVDATYESSKFVQVHNGMETGDATLLGARFGVRAENWEFAVFGRNIGDEDSIPMATRWFDVFAGFRETNPAGSDVSVLGPRAPFVSFRKGRQWGISLSYDF